jgi:hypothetical protein
MHADSDKNVEAQVAWGFGGEWSTFRQDETRLAREQPQTIFENYFHIFLWRLRRYAPIRGGAFAPPRRHSI